MLNIQNNNNTYLKVKCAYFQFKRRHAELDEALVEMIVQDSFFRGGE